MFAFAVDDGCEVVPRIVLDVFPNVHYRTARRVDEDYPLALQNLELTGAHPKSGQEDDVVLRDGGELFVGPIGAIEELDPHFRQAPVYVGVVDDLARNKDSLAGKARARFIGVLHRAIDAVAEAELLRESESELTRDELVIALAGEIHDEALIVPSQRLLDLLSEAEPLPIKLRFGVHVGHLEPIIGVCPGPSH